MLNERQLKIVDLLEQQPRTPVLTGADALRPTFLAN